MLYKEQFINHLPFTAGAKESGTPAGCDVFLSSEGS